MRANLLISLFAGLFVVTPVIGQPAQLGGRIVDDTGAPVSGANVVLEGTVFGTSSHPDGQFVLAPVPAGRYTLVTSHVGYQKDRRRVEIGAGDSLHVDVVLSGTGVMPQIDVVGRRPEALVRVPGSASVLSQVEITRSTLISSTDAFRRVTGVHAVEEEGAGLRANIGIRGLDPDRSRTVLVMEDGIPVALAPYGEPEMYYTPSMQRMAGVEIVKGSGSILFGPQTFGGVINYLTADPPAVPTATVHLRGGESGFFVGKLGYGNTVGNAGYQVTYLRRQGSEIGTTEFSLNDLNAKLRYALSERSFLGVKLAAYEENSNSTYVGLTQAMYESGAFDDIHVAPNDRLSITRYATSATLDHFFSVDLRLRTTGFAYRTSRNWMRQDFDVQPASGREYDRIVGDSSIPGGALYFRNATGNRNRQFEVAGLEPRLTANYLIAGMPNELDAGVRILFERAYEQRVDGTPKDPFEGNLREEETRTGYAASAYVQNRFSPTAQFSVTPGLRLENFTYQRDIRRRNNEYAPAFARDHVLEVIPGLGLNYRFGEKSSLFAGVHRGFGPPRVKDAISATGRSQELDAELSWNYEFGTRWNPLPAVHMELTGFYMDFSNQIIPVAESSGGPGSVPEGVGLINGGATRHTGVEAGLTFDAGRYLATGYRLAFNTNLTFTRAVFSEDRHVQAGDEKVNVKGNELPYAPGVLVSSVVDFHSPAGAGLRLTGTYIGRQYGDVLNRTTPTLDGRHGQIDPHLVVDLVAGYDLPALPDLAFTVAVKNLFNERYIVSRRPQGIRVGLPRFVTAGLDWKF